MRILYITPGCFDKGGISRYSRYQIRALKEEFGQKNIRVVSFLGPDQFSFEEKIDVDYYGKANNFWERILFVLAIVRYCITLKPQIVHSAHINYAGLIHFLKIIFRFKFFLNVYGLEVWSNPSKASLRGLYYADTVISDCHATKKYIVSHGLIGNNENMHVIWDCVDTDLFNPKNDFTNIRKKYNLPDRSKYFFISTFGRISRDAAYKGYERLLTVFDALSKKNSSMKLIFIGKGDMIPYLKNICTEKNISDKVYFTGAVTDTELPYLLSYGHVFSLVTESGKGKGEGLPLTPIEAMACGLPVIVGNEDGSEEVVFNGQNGIVINPGDFEQHQKFIEMLYNDRMVQKDKSENARALALEHFSYLKFREKLILLYNA